MAGNLTAMIAAIFSGGVTADPYFEYTTLLLPGNGTNGAQNNTFLDGSTNNFTITRSGNTTQGTFSPFSQTGWSGSFGNASSWITTNTTAFSNTASTWTIEAWVYMNALPTTDPPPMFGDMQAGGTTNYLSFGPDLNGKLQLYWFDGATRTAVGNTAMSLNTWNHVAISVNAGAISLFVNGTLQTITGTSTLTNRSGTTGANVISRSYTAFFNAYISNLRVTTTAVYSGSFTPSTTPLTAITGTQLLLFTGNRFVDANTQTTPKTLTITTNSGYPAVVPFSPFNPTSAWSASTVGGSGYFDGSGDYLTVANNAAFNFGTGDFTVEFWFYALAPAANSRFLSNAAYNASGIDISWESGSTRIAWYISSTPYVIPLPDRYAWHHVAFTRSGTTLNTYINGARANTYTNSSNITSANALGIGAESGGTNVTNSYISNLRLVKGTALYTGATYTVPTAPPTNITNTSLLLNFTNAGIYDATSKNDLETVGNAQISTAQSKFPPSSMAFDGTTDYLVEPTSVYFGYGTGDFTIEFWVYFNSTGTSTIFSNLSGTASTNPHIYINSTLRYYTAGSDRITSSTSPSTGVWYHLAVCRASGSTRMFLNGTQTGSTYADTNDYGQSAPLGVGTYWNGGAPVTASTLNGYLQDVRVSKYARYTSNFTAPTAAFPTL